MKHLAVIALLSGRGIIHEGPDGNVSTFGGRIFPAEESHCPAAEPQANPPPGGGPAGSSEPPCKPIEWPKIGGGDGLFPRLRAPKQVDADFSAWNELARHVETLKGPQERTFRVRGVLPAEADQYRLLDTLRTGVAVTILMEDDRA